MIALVILWKLCRTGKAGDAVCVLQWLVPHPLDRAHHLNIELSLISKREGEDFKG